jgi:two-component system response regulator DesR
MLGEQPWVERCLSARNADEAFQLATRYDPHVALVDLFVGQDSGAEICERLQSASSRAATCC